MIAEAAWSLALHWCTVSVSALSFIITTECLSSHLSPLDCPNTGQARGFVNPVVNKMLLTLTMRRA